MMGCGWRYEGWRYERFERCAASGVSGLRYNGLRF